MKRRTLDSFAAIRLKELADLLSTLSFSRQLDVQEDIDRAIQLANTSAKILGAQRHASTNVLLVRMPGYHTLTFARQQNPIDAARLADLIHFVRLGGWKMPNWDDMDNGPWNFSRLRAGEDHDQEFFMVDIIKKQLALF